MGSDLLKSIPRSLPQAEQGLFSPCCDLPTLHIFTCRFSPERKPNGVVLNASERRSSKPGIANHRASGAAGAQRYNCPVYDKTAIPTEFDHIRKEVNNVQPQCREQPPDHSPQARGCKHWNNSIMPFKNLLMVGDIVGEPGLETLRKHLPPLIEQYAADFVIVNGENTYEGKGLRPADADAIFKSGAHVITSGNHVWERWQSKDVLINNRNVLRPLNYPRENVGYGYTVFTLPDGTKIGVINLQGRTFLPPIDCPFHAADWAIGRIEHDTRCIVVDFHAEATAEKMAMGWYLDGRVSAVVGTHTHVQTNDARILPGGTAFLTDVGMTGPYDSVIGMKKEVAIRRFLTQTPHKFEMGQGDGRLSAAFIRIDTTTGKAHDIEAISAPEFVRSRS
jgi:metallophosphoesterase (TIGR00282 family)